MICAHTYGRWEEKQCLCAVCSENLHHDYNASFNGVFPVEDLVEANTRIENAFTYASTSYVNIPRTLRIDGEDEYLF